MMLAVEGVILNIGRCLRSKDFVNCKGAVGILFYILNGVFNGFSM